MSDNKLIRQHFDITLKAIYKDTFTKNVPKYNNLGTFSIFNSLIV